MLKPWDNGWHTHYYNNYNDIKGPSFNNTVQDLRSVFHQIEPRPKTNSVVKFIKMKRKKSTVVSVPVGPSSDFWLGRYERVVPLSDEAILEKIIEKEEIELAIQEAECEESEKPFVSQAKEMLATRRSGLKVG